VSLEVQKCYRINRRESCVHNNARKRVRNSPLLYVVHQFQTWTL